jgi:hypothetical protein
VAGAIREFKNQADFFALDAFMAMAEGVEAGQTAGQIFASYALNEAIGFGIGYAIGKGIGLVSEVWHNGITILPRASRRASEEMSRPVALIFFNSAEIQAPGRVAKVLGEAPKKLKITRQRMLDHLSNEAQIAIAETWVDWARRAGARDIRFNQAQVNALKQKIGRNKPDLQFTLEGGQKYELPNGREIEVPLGSDRRFYVEWDTNQSSGSSRDHLLDLIGHDRDGVVILESTHQHGLLDSAIYHP